MYIDPVTRVLLYPLIVGVVWGLLVGRYHRDLERGLRAGGGLMIGLGMYGAILVGAVA